MSGDEVGMGMNVGVYQDRLAQLQHYLDRQTIDGLLILNAANVMWASGFFHIPNERPLGLFIPADGAPTLFVPFLEKENAEANWIEDVRWYWEFPGKIAPEVWMMQNIPGKRIAVDSAGYGVFKELQLVKPDLHLDSGVAKMRYLKNPTELALTGVAAGYADFGLSVARQAVADGIHNGITEVDVVEIVKSETTAKMRKEFGDLLDYYRGAVALTAHTGPAAALPHGRPAPTPISPGDTLIVGIGVKVSGYHAESGCTFVVGEPNANQLRCLQATWACDEAALDALRPGNTCEAVDQAALDVLREAGFGDAIRHRIGHGMGIEGHEAPWLSEGDQTVLQPSMVFSNEPGIYRPGVDGYRIIDTMVVTESGGRRLSNYLTEHGPDDRVIPV